MSKQCFDHLSTLSACKCFLLRTVARSHGGGCGVTHIDPVLRLYSQVFKFGINSEDDGLMFRTGNKPVASASSKPFMGNSPLI